MKEVDFVVPKGANLRKADHFLERSFTSLELRIALKTSLASYPGCIHWHLKRGTEKGTLEITYLREGPRLWAKIQAGRVGPWIARIVPKLRKLIKEEWPLE